MSDHVLLRMEKRFDRFERLLDTRFDQLDRRFDRFDDKLSRHFRWLVGLQGTTLVAILGALLTRP